MRINVYDTGNQKRLLGTVDMSRFGKARGRRYAFAAMPKRAAAKYHSPGDKFDYFCPPELREIRLDIGGTEPLAEHGDWMHRTFLTTDAPLDSLMLIREFHLPGENDEQAHIRRHYC